MIQRIAPRKRIGRMLACLALVICCRTVLMAQSQGPADSSKTAATLRARHILGFEGISNNAHGDLAIQGDNLLFQRAQGSPAQIAIRSIQDLTLGVQDQQVGGVPMTLLRTATPYGGGRVISVFSHKKFDTVTLEYLDSNGGFHGAIFQVNKGQGQVLESPLEARGVHIGSPVKGISKQSIQETSAADTRSPGPQWSVQVMKVDMGDVNIEPAFQVAIYENLLDELIKTKEFQQVLRDGDRTAGGIQNLLALRSTVESFTPGSETRRAVTTVSGATKLRVRTQLCKPGGQVVLERTSDGNVRFFGGNLRATHNLARNVAKAVKQSALPNVTPSLADSKTAEPLRLQSAR